MVQETTSKTSCGSVYRERAVDVGGGDCGIRRKAQERGSMDSEGASAGNERYTGTMKRSNPSRELNECHVGATPGMRCGV